ncbi:lytic transglycosylase domain-containing protein [Kineosporia sp. NBRC 101731]|uniref:lytic transglycosylase domain-containing protein n=1 Tax=Kineosporia sp. NBRC 101731 TaxID=3032199 RepID=UPI0024A4D826|nr:lytic transglycosylase domain-containing protein [Kineosporia sp. NBRC 101731]GLY31689.1 hypothetical protein Kisp02_50540 [Kineosporia sp. NBRC 101731]
MTSRWLLAFVIAAGVLVPAAGTAQASSVTQAQRRAARAQGRVDRLVDQYEDAEMAMARQLSRVSRAFSVADAASADAERLKRLEHRAAARRARDVRAVYAAGGTVGLMATLLLADSPSDALWRYGTNDRLLKSVLDSDQQILRDTQAVARRAGQKVAQADAAAVEQSAAMGELRQDADRARIALAKARTTLARLDRRAQQARAVQAARERIAQAQRQAREQRRRATGVVTALGIPAEYQIAYQDAAGTCASLRWTLLAAVGQVESGHGRNVGPSSAGAQGPMQFMPATFAAYGVDGDLNGVTDIQDPQDAIFSAANYLCASGIGRGTGDSAARDRTALFAYNRADWYVDLVLSAEQAIIARAAEVGQ